MSPPTRFAASAGLNARLAQFVLIAAAPMFAVLVGVAAADHRSAIAEAQAQVLRSARMAAERQDDQLVEAFSLLRALAHVPAVIDASEACHGILRDVADDHPHMDELSVFGPDGAVLCDSILASPQSSVAGRDFFPLPMTPDGPAVVQGRLAQDAITGNPTMFAALALPPSQPGGRPAGGLGVSLNLQWFSRLAARSMNTVTQTVLVIDPRDGALLARAPELQGTAEHVLDDPALLDAIRSSPEGGLLSDGGTIYGFVPLRGTGASAVVAVGLDVQSMLAGANRRLAAGLVLSLAVTFCAAVAARGIALRAVLRPLEGLRSAAARLGDGVPGARASIAGRCPAEIDLLAQTFDGLAASIDARGRALGEMQEGLAQSEAHHRLLAEHGTDLILRLAPDGRRLYVSPACRDMLGYEPQELEGRQSLSTVLPQDRPSVAAMLARLTTGAVERQDFRCRRKDGTIVWVEMTARGRGPGQDVIASVRDVSARKQLEEQLSVTNARLELLAMQDGLTSLANRRQFDEAIEREFRRAQRTASPLCLVMVDVDRFKAFNDRDGHPAGDACLKQVAHAIQACVCRPGDLAARYGGEEIAVLLPGTDAAGGVVIAQRVQEAVRNLMIPHSANVCGIVTISAGVASMTAGLDTMQADHLIMAADQALYAAKRAGRDTIRVAEEIGLVVAENEPLVSAQ